MKTALITILVFAIAWTVAYFVVLRHWLMQYKITARIIERTEAAEGSLWTRIKLWFEGKKALILAFLGSGIAAAKAATDATVSTVTALTPADLTPLQDKSIWGAFFNDIWTLHILAALSLLTGLLAIRGHLVAAKVTPGA